MSTTKTGLHRRPECAYRRETRDERAVVVVAQIRGPVARQIGAVGAGQVAVDRARVVTQRRRRPRDKYRPRDGLRFAGGSGGRR